MGMRMPETCWAVFKRQVINLRSCCILLVDSVESIMMHGLANPKKCSYDIWCSQSGTDANSSVPRRYNAPTGKYFPPLVRTVLPPPSAFSYTTIFGRLDPGHEKTTIPRNDESVWPLTIRNIWISNYCLSSRLLPLHFSLFPSDRYTHVTSRMQSLLCKLLDYQHPFPPAVIKSAATSANHPERLINAYSHTRRNLSR